MNIISYFEKTGSIGYVPPNQKNLNKKLEEANILVYSAISANRVIGSYYFEESVNKENYLEMLKTFFWTKVLRTAEYEKYHFQQDGSAPHTARTVQSWLRDKF